MFDIHYHLLHGLDDGPRTIEASLELAEASIAEGVTHIVCTPHANDKFTFRSEVNQAIIAELNKHLDGRVTLGSGCDFHFSYENLADIYKKPTKYTINNKQYLLLEFPDYAIPPNTAAIIFQLMTHGIIPIITHPERNPILASDSKRVADLLRCGCLMQITGGSLLGRFGKNAETTARRFIEMGWAHFIASDAHSLKRRPPDMARAYDLIQSRYGRETADRLCLHNPRAVFFGDQMPLQPKSIETPEYSVKRKILARIFGR